jgi:hypothetical protein
VLCAFGFAILLSFVFMYTLRCLAGLIVWLSALGIIGALLVAGIIFLYNAGVISSLAVSSGWLSIPTISGDS